MFPIDHVGMAPQAGAGIMVCRGVGGMARLTFNDSAVIKLVGRPVFIQVTVGAGSIKMGRVQDQGIQVVQ